MIRDTERRHLETAGGRALLDRVDRDRGRVFARLAAGERLSAILAALDIDADCDELFGARLVFAAVADRSADGPRASVLRVLAATTR